jgi:hypothetical protein
MLPVSSASASALAAGLSSSLQLAGLLALFGAEVCPFKRWGQVPGPAIQELWEGQASPGGSLFPSTLWPPRAGVDAPQFIGTQLVAWGPQKSMGVAMCVCVQSVSTCHPSPVLP